MYLEEYGWCLVVLRSDLSSKNMPVYEPLFVNISEDFIVGIKYCGSAICHISLPSHDIKDCKSQVYVPGNTGKPNSIDLYLKDKDVSRPIQNIFLRPDVFPMIEEFIGNQTDFNVNVKAMVEDLRKALRKGSNVS